VGQLVRFTIPVRGNFATTQPYAMLVSHVMAGVYFKRKHTIGEAGQQCFISESKYRHNGANILAHVLAFFIRWRQRPLKFEGSDKAKISRRDLRVSSFTKHDRYRYSRRGILEECASFVVHFRVLPFRNCVGVLCKSWDRTKKNEYLISASNASKQRCLWCH
jgi:hypothetical protein